MVQITSRKENDFIFKIIVEPIGSWIWLGATNIIGTNTCKWLDGSELTNFGSTNTAVPIQLNAGIYARNGLMMFANPLYQGGWFGYKVSTTICVLCENVPADARKPAMPVTTELTKQTTRSSEFVGPDDRLEQGYSNIRRLTETNSNKIDQQNDAIRELKSQANDNAFEVQFQKQQSNQLIGNLKTDAEKSMKLIEDLESQFKMIKKQNDLLIQRNELLEMRMNRLEQKMSTNN